MRGFIRRYAPAFFAVSVLWEMLAILVVLSVQRNQGHWIYGLDDAYIHMAMAKNLALHGVYGVTPYAFTPAASSILWTLLLAIIYFIFGLSDLVPLLLNVIFASGTVILVYAILLRYRRPDRFAMLVLLGLIFATPLLALITTGLEHTAHILVTLAFVFLAAEILASDSDTLRRGKIVLLALAPLVSGFRYEGLFPIAMICLLFLLRRRFWYAVLLGGLAALPVLIFGLISVGQGWFFLPAPVLLKGVLPNVASVANTMNAVGVQRLLGQPHITVLVFAALILLLLGKRDTWWSAPVIALVVFIWTAVLHVQLIDSYPRYDAYVVALGIVALAVAVSDLTRSRLAVRLKPRFVAAIGLAALVIAPLISRSVIPAFDYFQGTTNIFEQQYQMALFVRDFYQGQPVVINDIGAIDYLTDIHCVDIFGLGDRDAAWSKVSQKRFMDAAQNEALARQKNARIAIVYAFEGMIPDSWIKVGEWTIANNRVAASATVSFFATEPSEADKLMTNLRAFAPRLPSTVAQAGLYMQSARQ